MIKKTIGNTTYEFDNVKELVEFEGLHKPTKTTTLRTIAKTLPEPRHTEEKHTRKYNTRVRKHKSRVNWKERAQTIAKHITKDAPLLHVLNQLKIPVGGNYKIQQKVLKQLAKKDKTFEIYYKGKICYVRPLKKEGASSLENISFRNVPEQYQKINKDILLNMIKTHNRITYENEGYMIGIEDKNAWDDYIIELLQKAPEITRKLNVSNNFKIITEGRQKWLIYR